MACEVCDMIQRGAKKIYEDEKAIAMLSTRPASVGHILVAPKQHFPILEQAPDFLVAHLFSIVNKMSMVVFEVLRVQGTNVILTNGVAAGQRYNHLIINIIPRTQNDGLSFNWNPKQLTEEEMSTVELELKEQAKNIGGFEKEPQKPVEIKAEREVISDDEENYLIRQLRRIP